MKDSRIYNVYPSNLDILKSFRCYGDFVRDRGFENDTGSLINNFSLKVSEYREIEAENFEEFLTVLERYPDSMPITCHTKWKRGTDYELSSYIRIIKSVLSVSIKSDDIDAISSMHDNIKYCFQASNPHQDKIERLVRSDLKKSVFIAHKFDEVGSVLSGILSKFLSNLNFDVKEGAGYKSNDIPGEISRMIDCQDIFICLVTPGDTSWILSEAVYAKTKNKYLIILHQNKVPFEKGIIGGDYEHLAFTGSEIEKSFTELVSILPI